MTDPKIGVLFTGDEAAGLGRCRDCGWHAKTQGHDPRCVHAPPAPPPPPDHSTRRARYLARLCTDCGATPSAGRLRCNPCHDHYRRSTSDG